MFRQTASLCGLTVELVCQETHHGEAIYALWRELFCIDGAGGPALEPSFRLQFKPPKWGAGTAVRGEKVFESASLLVLKCENGFYFRCGSSELELDVSQGCGEGVLDSGFWTCPLRDRREFFLLAFLMLMRQHGLYGLHANGVAKDDSGCLIIGYSGAGKTTLSIGLLKEGWSYLSDDAIMLRKNSNGVEALAFRRGFSLTQATSVHFPELNISTTSATTPGYGAASAYGRLNGDKRALDLDPLFPGMFASRCVPRLMLFPEISSRSRSELIPLGYAEALTSLLGQSPGIMTDKVLVSKQLRVLTSLVEQTKSYRLLAGSDVYQRPDTVSQLLTRARAG